MVGEIFINKKTRLLFLVGSLFFSVFAAAQEGKVNSGDINVPSLVTGEKKEAGADKTEKDIAGGEKEKQAGGQQSPPESKEAGKENNKPDEKVLPQEIKPEEAEPEGPKMLDVFANIISRQKNSMMFGEEDLKKLYEAMSGVVTEAKIETKEVEEPAVTEKRVAPTFFLNSVLYFSDKRWVAWVNGQYMKPEMEKNEIEVISVKKDKATIVWYAKDLDAISAGWKNKFYLIEPKEGSEQEVGYLSKDKKIFVTKDSSVVEFTIAPNQTMVIEKMEIGEGYIKPTVVNITTRNGKAVIEPLESNGQKED